MAESRKYDNSNNHEVRICLLEQSIGHINETLIRMEKILENMSQEIKQNYKDLNSRLWSNFLWTIGSMAGLFVMVSHALHWI